MFCSMTDKALAKSGCEKVSIISIKSVVVLVRFPPTPKINVSSVRILRILQNKLHKSAVVEEKFATNNVIEKSDWELKIIVWGHLSF